MLAPLNAQLQTSWFMLWAGLEGLSDEEYLWEAVPGSWTVRVHPDARWRRRRRGAAGGADHRLADVHPLRHPGPPL